MLTRNLYTPNHAQKPAPRSITQTRLFWFIIVPLACFIVMGIALYTPLALSLAENHLIGSDYIYEAFDSVNLADPLGKLYLPLLEQFPFLNP